MTMELQDGYSILIEFNADNSVQLWEKAVTPPGIDGGPAVDTKTMRNVEWATKAPQTLMEVQDAKFKATYDPDVYDAGIVNLINVNDVIHVTFPDGSVYSFWGYLQKFIPDEIKFGEQPTAECTIVITNVDFNTRDVDGRPIEDGPGITVAGLPLLPGREDS